MNIIVTLEQFEQINLCFKQCYSRKCKNIFIYKNLLSMISNWTICTCNILDYEILLLPLDSNLLDCLFIMFVVNRIHTFSMSKKGGVFSNVLLIDIGWNCLLCPEMMRICRFLFNLVIFFEPARCSSNVKHSFETVKIITCPHF